MDWLTLKVGAVWVFLWVVTWLFKKWVDDQSAEIDRAYLTLPLMLGTIITSVGFLLFFGCRFLLLNLQAINPSGIHLLLLFSVFLFFSLPLSMKLRWPTRRIFLDQLLLALGLSIIAFGVTLGGVYLPRHLTANLLIYWVIASFLISTMVQIVFLVI